MDRTNEVFYWLPCTVVFVSTAHGGRRDIMTATAMFVSEKEPLVLVSVAEGRLTERLIERSGRFTLVIAAKDQRKLALKVGSSRGEEADKFERFSIATVTPPPVPEPVPRGAAAWMACEVENDQRIRGYRLFIGRVVERRDLGREPLIWQRDGFFTLSPIP